MLAQELRDLIEHANISLIDTGRFPVGWSDHYRSVLSQIVGLCNGATWPKELFASLHYISTHLCIRYRARKDSIANRIAETEATLGRIQLETERILWTAVTTLPSGKTEGVRGNDETTLISLCFGECSPLQPVTEETSFKAWKTSYQACLGNVQENMRRTDDWNMWLCVALHFGAFYVDLYQQQDIDLGENCERRMTNKELSSLLVRLSASIENERVLKLIELWLDSTHKERNASGLPYLGKPRPRTGQFISVRTATELLIQSSVNASYG